MNIKVNLQDSTPAQFKTEIIDDAIVVTVVGEEKEEVNLFPKWEELNEIEGYYVVSNFTTEDLAKAALATARVSQTYKRYREFVGGLSTSIVWQSEVAIIKSYGLLRMTFANSSDWEKFYESNKEDLKVILYVSSNTQL